MKLLTDSDRRSMSEIQQSPCSLLHHLHQQIPGMMMSRRVHCVVLCCVVLCCVGRLCTISDCILHMLV